MVRLPGGTPVQSYSAFLLGAYNRRFQKTDRGGSHGPILLSFVERYRRERHLPRQRWGTGQGWVGNEEARALGQNIAPL